MAPRKQSQKQQNPSQKKIGSKGKSGPEVQLSAQNEQKLRRLLLNNAPRANIPSSSVSSSDSMSDAQRRKRMISIYDKLACEGFTNDQIERALSALTDQEVTLELALDWLCLNVSGDELPSKFSSGVSSFEVGKDTGRTVNVLAASSENWVPLKDKSEELAKEDLNQNTLRIKKCSMEEENDLLKSKEADWIRNYLSQQQEEESNNENSDVGNDSDTDWELWTDPTEQARRKQQRSAVDREARVLSIVEEYKAARQAATEAKLRGDKQKQEVAGHLICGLKKEMQSLGVSEDTISQSVQSFVSSQSNHLNDFKDHEPDMQRTHIDSDLSMLCDESNCASHKKQVDKKLETHKKEEEDDEELCGLFDDELSENIALPDTVIEMQKKEKAVGCIQGQTKGGKQEKQFMGGKSAKQEDVRKQPKAILQQQCQKSGWAAPKYEKVFGKGNAYSYCLSILRPSVGRGKSKKVGGVFKFQFPEPDYVFESVDDAQNGVATVALFHLFPDTPLHQMLSEPYRSFVLKWMTGDSKHMENEDARRADFVKSLVVTNTFNKLPNPRKEEEAAISQYDETLSEYVSSFQERSNSDKEAESYHLKKSFEKKKQNVKYKVMLKARKTLPIAELKEELLQSVKENDVIVVSGETGSGKTTQVPQYILDEMIESGRGGFCNVICTQPRRIAAISVAERVAEERCEPSPGARGSLVGYQVRLVNSWNSETRLMFCTTGILLRKLIGDPYLKDVSHVIVDEVHERTVLGDFLLIILKDLLERRSSCNLPKIKLILMSATVDASLFSHYYGNCPVINVKGRTHPVSLCFLEDIYESLGYFLPSDSSAALSNPRVPKRMIAKSAVDNSRGRKNLIRSGWGDESLLEDNNINVHYDEDLYLNYSKQTRRNLKLLNEDVIDYDLLEDLVRYIDNQFEPGAMLVFLPGMTEIQMLVDRLTATHQFGAQASEWIVPLYSSLPSEEQRKAFKRPPEGIRKIVVATNIAETSITIDDVVYVIDSGKHKENHYNPEKKMSSMVEAWISQANAKQRRGRAGRVKPGTCFCLYTKYRYEKLMRPFQVPEMLRVPLVELCLQIKLMSLGDVFSFLQKAIEPPRKEALVSAIATLLEVGAIDESEKLTPLGHHLAKLPVDVRIGKMMLYGSVFGCLAPILTIAACLSYKSPFITSNDEKSIAERARLLSSEKSDHNVFKGLVQEQYSDHILSVVAYNKWKQILSQNGKNGTRAFCRSHSLNEATLYMIRDMRIQFANLLAEIGFIELPKADQKKKDVIEKFLDDPSHPFNTHAQEPSVVKSIICAGLYPNIAKMEEDSIKGHPDGFSQHAGLAPTNRPRWFDSHQEVFIHPSSINHSVSHFPHTFIVFLEKVQTSKIFLRDTTLISPYSVLLFGGSINIKHQTGSVDVDGWLKMNAPAQTAVLFKELRLSLHSILKELIQKPKERTTISKREVIHSIIKLLNDEEQSRLH
eukprot:TRINITY_DN6191_c0_g1_i1.p1 TRINITY_DN6191_c0_g1~~TRINITY_DN6191_c0_g1_i1.p1  ORF type:complete len:1460 (-),score=349.95 TRINITY_DN6191_c0_g1_i1:511-4890(-)